VRVCTYPQTVPEGSCENADADAAHADAATVHADADGADAKDAASAERARPGRLASASLRRLKGRLTLLNFKGLRTHI
jgi:hypothetical protein